jgi:glycine/serine hydroxymethyltransferase
MDYNLAHGGHLFSDHLSTHQVILTVLLLYEDRRYRARDYDMMEERELKEKPKCNRRCISNSSEWDYERRENCESPEPFSWSIWHIQGLIAAGLLRIL